jgi:hypothetical protein
MNELETVPVVEQGSALAQLPEVAIQQGSLLLDAVSKKIRRLKEADDYNTVSLD